MILPHWYTYSTAPIIADTQFLQIYTHTIVSFDHILNHKTNSINLKVGNKYISKDISSNVYKFCKTILSKPWVNEETMVIIKCLNWKKKPHNSWNTVKQLKTLLSLFRNYEQLKILKSLSNYLRVLVSLTLWLSVKESSCQCRRCWVLGLGRSPGIGNGNLF